MLGNEGLTILNTESVESKHLVDNSIDSDKIMNNAITPSKINIFDDMLNIEDGQLLISDGDKFSNITISGDIDIDKNGITKIKFPNSFGSLYFIEPKIHWTRNSNIPNINK